jgi:hypothetical protein
MTLLKPISKHLRLIRIICKSYEICHYYKFKCDIYQALLSGDINQFDFHSYCIRGLLDVTDINFF